MARDGRRISLRRMRAGLLVLTLLLLVAVAGFLGYARYKLRHLDFGFGRLAGRLGATITQESDNFTYSQSVGNRKIFTVHAAKQIDHGNGMFTLHDVNIVLYGRDADHADQIRGSQFEYDQKNSILRAVGDVYIDLSAPAREQSVGPVGTHATSPNAEENARIVHIKTSGLVFQQKDRSATTEKQVDFQVGSSKGTALGASYDSGSGVVILQSAVKVTGFRGKTATAGAEARPTTLTAAHAEMDRQGNVIELNGPKLATDTDSGTETATAEHAVVHVNADGTPQQVDAEGRVLLTAESRGGRQESTSADRMQLELNGEGKPRFERLRGNVHFTARDTRRQQEGHGAEAQVAFDAVGRPVHAQVTGDVQMKEQDGGNERQLNAAKVDLALAGGGKQPVLLTGAIASGTGGAVLRTLERRADGSTAINGLRGDVLTARFALDAPAPSSIRKPGTHLTGLEGRGSTYLEQISRNAKGMQTTRQTSTGETLDADFRLDDAGKVSLARATQRGMVSVVREVPARLNAGGPGAKVAAAQVQHAKSDAALYDADLDRLVLTGGVQVQDAESALFADRVQLDHATGDSLADGSVRVSYLQNGSSGEPLHILAARAISHEGTGVSDFFGGPSLGGRAKMWQGGSQVEAPLLEFHRTERTFTARDEHGAQGAVHTVLMDTGRSDGKPQARPPDTPVRVISREMTYNDAKRQVSFAGDVRVQDKDGTMRSDEATVYLLPVSIAVKPRVQSATDAAPISLGGRLDRIVGTGSVVLEQPDRRATGERLLYTAEDQTFVLTGTASDPPKMVDTLQGNVTGASLRFTSGEDRVVISGKADSGESQRVHSETKVKGKKDR